MLFEPFKASQIRKMLHREIFKSHLKAISIGTGTHNTDLYRLIFYKPRNPHHNKVRSIEENTTALQHQAF